MKNRIKSKFLRIKMNDKILLSHGGGGEEMNALIDGLIFKIFKKRSTK